MWTDGSRQENGAVGAACAWRTQEVWAGRRYHLGSSVEVFEAEVFAYYRVLSTIEQRAPVYDFRRLHFSHYPSER